MRLPRPTLCGLEPITARSVSQCESETSPYKLHKMKPQTNTDERRSVLLNPKILCWQERIFLRALRGFAVNPGLDFHPRRRKHAKNAKDSSLAAALLVCVHRCSSVVSFIRMEEFAN